MAANNQAGAASVTMAGALVPGTRNWEHNGSSPPKLSGQMNNYFFLPSGFTAGTGDEASWYQGWGSKPLK
jgi:hypothetical protein